VDFLAFRFCYRSGAGTRRQRLLAGAGLALLAGLAATNAALAEGGWHLGASRGAPDINDEPTKFLTEGDIPPRPKMILEIGDDFLGQGNLSQGFELPTGAVWAPSLWVFGTLRTALQSIDNGAGDRITEWANRFDFFSNLQLTGTEKLVLGIRPLDKNRPGEFSGYRFEPEDDDGFKDFTNANIRTLFFEGDLGSLFPNFDKPGQSWLDFGFTVGRQPLIFQDGILLNDTQDALGIVRNNVRLPGVSNLRVSALWGWGSVSRGATGVAGTEDDDEPQSFGLFTNWDSSFSTYNLDFVYVADNEGPDGDGVYGGLSVAQRLGRYSATWRVNGSYAVDEETELVTDGALFSTEFSWTPHGSDDTVWINPFFSIGTFTQAGREPVDGGGPLAPLGILFASPNIGAFGSELDNKANDVAGGAIGYQAFWNDHWTNLGLEIAGRKDLGLEDDIQQSFDWQVGVGFQAQQKVTQQSLVQLEGFYVRQDAEVGDIDDNAYGGRLEFLYQF
jgi:hypothetical protein